MKIFLIIMASILLLWGCQGKNYKELEAREGDSTFSAPYPGVYIADAGTITDSIPAKKMYLRREGEEKFIFLLEIESDSVGFRTVGEFYKKNTSPKYFMYHWYRILGPGCYKIFWKEWKGLDSIYIELYPKGGAKFSWKAFPKRE